jgi:hypothetical protein
VRAVSDELARVLDEGQYEVSLGLDAFYGAERTLQGLTVDASWELKWVKSADVPGSGSVLVQMPSTDGTSLTPREFTARLAPFGQEVAPLLSISAGQFTETVQAGRFRIADVPSARDETLRHSTRTVTVGSYVKLALLDQLEAVRAAGFARPENPVHTSDAWQELARLTGMRILRNGVTAAVPASITYEMTSGGRLKAVRELAAVLGGTPYVLSDGALTVVPDGPLAPVRRFTVGDTSTLLGFEYAMSSDGVFNEVVGIFEDADRNPIVVPPAQVTSGPLAVSGPFGRRTRYYASPFVKTPTQAASALQKILAQASQMKAFRVLPEFVLDPRIEVGDTIEIEQAEQTYLGVVAEVTWRANGKMTLGVDIYQSVDEANLLEA